MPFAVVGSNTLIEVCGKKVRGRLYPWGVVEGKMNSLYGTIAINGDLMKYSCCFHSILFSVENPRHCDFVKLRTMLM